MASYTTKCQKSISCLEHRINNRNFRRLMVKLIRLDSDSLEALKRNFPRLRFNILLPCITEIEDSNFSNCLGKYRNYGNISVPKVVLSPIKVIVNNVDEKIGTKDRREDMEIGLPSKVLKCNPENNCKTNSHIIIGNEIQNETLSAKKYSEENGVIGSKKICKIKFLSRHYLEPHNKRPVKEKPLKCRLCKKLLSSYKCLKEHLVSDHPNRKYFKCRVCLISFFKRRELLDHEESHEKKVHKCNLCGKCFISNAGLNQHISAHHCKEEPYKCKNCGKRYKYSSSLVCHEKTHSSEKPETPFKCNFCEKGFVSHTRMNLHITFVHCKERYHKCQFCDKYYAMKSDRINHERVHSGIRPYKCDICGKDFTQKPSLKKHKLLHTGLKRYKCQYCETFFAQIGNAKRHEKLHNGRKSYKCSLCEKSFFKRSTLKSHKRRRHGILKPYHCKSCRKFYSDYSSLIRHQRLHCKSEL